MTAVLPPGAIAVSPADLLALAALHATYDADGRATVRTVGAVLGLASPSAAHRRVRRLVRLGWAAHEAPGALRPLVEPMAVT